MREAIDDAAAVLRKGGLVAFPTETVYGLGALARDPKAVARIFAAKGRPANHPLIVHLAEAADVPRWAARIPANASKLMERFWPGPLTVILDKREDVPDAVTGGQDTIGLRVPAHEVANALLRAVGDGLAAPSANRFGAVSPTTAAHVALELGPQVDRILDGGACRVGIESTIVRVTDEGVSLLRPGAVTRVALEAEVGALRTHDPAIRAPGTLASHYAPRASVVVVDGARLEQSLSESHRGTVILSAAPVEGHPHIPLSSTPELAARQLYAALREVDARGYHRALVVLPSAAGIGEAVVDRIRRAAAQRDDLTPRD
ncbi:MAG: L-threonylcarbamoyladenylate synthase [Sandaracinaceae bacterium]